MMGTPGAPAPMQPNVPQPVLPGGTRPVGYPHGMRSRQAPNAQPMPMQPMGRPQGRGFGNQDMFLRAMLGGYGRR